MDEATRAWIYRVLTAVVPILIAYGVIGEQVAPLWIALGGAVLGIGMAAKNTSTNPGA